MMCKKTSLDILHKFFLSTQLQPLLLSDLQKKTLCRQFLPTLFKRQHGRANFPIFLENVIYFSRESSKTPAVILFRDRAKFCLHICSCIQCIMLLLIDSYSYLSKRQAAARSCSWEFLTVVLLRNLRNRKTKLFAKHILLHAWNINNYRSSWPMICDHDTHPQPSCRVLRMWAMRHVTVYCRQGCGSVFIFYGSGSGSRAYVGDQYGSGSKSGSGSNTDPGL